MNPCFDVFSIVFNGHIESRIVEKRIVKGNFGMLDFLLPQNASDSYRIYNQVNRSIEPVPNLVREDRPVCRLLSAVV